ncbi:hypothetical protein PFISCL1PPCAC_8868, partial [Pristionchus fissidentatus]
KLRTFRFLFDVIKISGKSPKDVYIYLGLSDSELSIFNHIKARFRRLLRIPMSYSRRVIHYPMDDAMLLRLTEKAKKSELGLGNFSAKGILDAFEMVRRAPGHSVQFRAFAPAVDEAFVLAEEKFGKSRFAKFVADTTTRVALSAIQIRDDVYRVCIEKSLFPY